MLKNHLIFICRILHKLDSVLTQLDDLVMRLDNQDRDMEGAKKVLKDIKARS